MDTDSDNQKVKTDNIGSKIASDFYLLRYAKNRFYNKLTSIMKTILIVSWKISSGYLFHTLFFFAFKQFNRF